MTTLSYQELKADASMRKELAESTRLKELNLSNKNTKPSYHSIVGKRKWIMKDGRWKKVLI